MLMVGAIIGVAALFGGSPAFASTYTWQDGGSGGWWGADNMGGSGDTLDSYTTGLASVPGGGKVCKPADPAGLNPDAILVEVVWFDNSNNVVYGPQGVRNDLYNAAWWTAFDGDIDPNPAYFTAPTGATKYAYAVYDFGPYDQYGNTSYDNGSYNSQYADPDALLAAVTSC
jgi:hypothetical protein